MNLTRIRDPKEIARRHILEGLVAGRLLERRGLKGPLVDFGSGNGFPGVPMAVAWPGALPLSLVESSEKRAAFLRVVLRELGWESSRVLVKKVERCSDLAGLPCRIFTSRGVALNPLLDEGLAFLEPGSTTVLFTSKPPESESFHGLAIEEFMAIRGRETGILLLRKH